MSWARTEGYEPLRLKVDERLMHEGGENDSLYILLKGEVQITKTGPDGNPQFLDLLGPGSVIGILSFWTGKPSFSESYAKTEVECLKVERKTFDKTVAEDPDFARPTLQILVANLSERYRRAVGLNLKVAGLTRELEVERNALQEAVQNLKETSNQLVHKEKLATMGQLLAGIAHEINNPSTSLMQSVSRLGRDLFDLMEGNPEHLHLLKAGSSEAYLSTSESRERLDLLLSEFPNLTRARARRLIRFPKEMLREIRPDLKNSRWVKIDEKIRIFELGSSLHSIQVANERITRLVKGLKSYSRQDESESVGVDLAKCIQDTLMVLNHRLKHYDLNLEVEELPIVQGRAGEINQILTNLLTNACEATEEGKKISLKAGKMDRRIWVEVQDEGHGIPEALLDKIFEPNVTTKSGGGQFGLGLGLAISRDLAMQNNGSLTAVKRDHGGALFRLELPLTSLTEIKNSASPESF